MSIIGVRIYIIMIHKNRYIIGYHRNIMVE